MTLKDLAAINGLSLSTAKRYQKNGVNLTDANAVSAYKFKLRTRRGVSKFAKRSQMVNKAVDVATHGLAGVIEELEEIICSVYWLAVESQPGENLAAEIIDRTRPVIDRIGAEA
jgi:hypothetical protein